MADVSIETILSGGGALGLAIVVWKTQIDIKAALEKLADKFSLALEKQSEVLGDALEKQNGLLSKMIERLARIDERTSGGGRQRLKTSPIGHRTKPITPFTEDDKE
jgi:hypothetical protein